jgi:prepilin-type N-terminal cleavage/methylation domain-containing protein
VHLRPPDSGRYGFTLLEALIALLLISAALLLGYGFLARQPQASARLDAGNDALRALEASLETLRSGAMPLEPGMLPPVIAYPPPTTARDLLVDLDVAATDLEGLFIVTLEARYRIGRTVQRRQVQSMIWSP